jgi:site-specific DNA-methyltransferase (adenine-specific)
LLLEPPKNTKRVLIYKKPPDAGILGSGAGFRKDVEAVYLLGTGWAQGGTRSAVIATAARGMSGTLTTPTGHPHAKPLDVLQFLILSCPPGAIADPFAGSGSTLVAAKLQGRQAIGVELEERYCEIAARRLAQGVLEFPA